MCRSHIIKSKFEYKSSIDDLFYYSSKQIQILKLVLLIGVTVDPYVFESLFIYKLLSAMVSFVFFVCMYLHDFVLLLVL